MDSCWLYLGRLLVGTCTSTIPALSPPGCLQDGPDEGGGEDLSREQLLRPRESQELPQGGVGVASLHAQWILVDIPVRTFLQSMSFNIDLSSMHHFSMSCSPPSTPPSTHTPPHPFHTHPLTPSSHTLSPLPPTGGQTDWSASSHHCIWPFRFCSRPCALPLSQQPAEVHWDLCAEGTLQYFIYKIVQGGEDGSVGEPMSCLAYIILNGGSLRPWNPGRWNLWQKCYKVIQCGPNLVFRWTPLVCRWW